MSPAHPPRNSPHAPRHHRNGACHAGHPSPKQSPPESSAGHRSPDSRPAAHRCLRGRRRQRRVDRVSASGRRQHRAGAPTGSRRTTIAARRAGGPTGCAPPDARSRSRKRPLPTRPRPLPTRPRPRPTRRHRLRATLRRRHPRRLRHPNPPRNPSTAARSPSASRRRLPTGGIPPPHSAPCRATP